MYATDALLEKQVRIVGRFPGTSHAVIVYPIAITINAQAGASGLAGFLRGRDAEAVFRKYGFDVLSLK